ncbi:hypothetical protein M0802_008323 [Mischocyttarus mexicanus]|nr:hypothetical protein M0802_008323 [Mischocyttarus mexicanus]
MMGCPRRRSKGVVAAAAASWIFRCCMDGLDTNKTKQNKKKKDRKSTRKEKGPCLVQSRRLTTFPARSPKNTSVLRRERTRTKAPNRAEPIRTRVTATATATTAELTERKHHHPNVAPK